MKKTYFKYRVSDNERTSVYYTTVGSFDRAVTLAREHAKQFSYSPRGAVKLEVTDDDGKVMYEEHI